MENFNHEFDNNNTPETNDTNNDIRPENAANTPEPKEQQPENSVEEGKNAQTDASASETGSYSYTGDRLTDSRTQVHQADSDPSSYGSERGRGEEPKQNQTSYNMPRMNGNGDISYMPSPENGGKKKEKKASTVTFTKGGVAVLCCAAIFLSAGTGFLGAYAANRLAGVGDAPAVNASDENDTSSTSNVGGAEDPTAVFYRAVSTTGFGSSQNGNLTYREVASVVQDSVVEIVTDFNKTSLWFQYVASGAGSGVIMSEDGYVITNNHVICDEETGKLSDSVTVRLRNGEEYKAEIIGADADSDIAVLKIEATGLTPAVSGNSDSLAVGEEVIAVGNPLGELGGTVTNGIVSATDREIVVGDVTMNLIQTNAAVNPGNSGGGLFNMSGELIGIVNAKSSGSDVEGLGFAIPVNDALAVTEQLLEFGYVRGKVMIGVVFLDATDASRARYYGLKQGIYVSELTKGYNDKNLKPGDRIIAINGNEVSAYEDITSAVKASEVGDILTFQLYRDGKLTEAQVEVFEKVPESMENGDVEFETEAPTYGFESEDVSWEVSPMPEDGVPGYNPFEGTPFEDFFDGWGW